LYFCPVFKCLILLLSAFLLNFVRF